MITGINSNKIETNFLWLTCTILCHCKEVRKIFDYKVSPFLDSQREGCILCYFDIFFPQNASRNRYDKNNPPESAYISSIYKMTFQLDFKPRID